jgi:hypothetical protein
MTTFLRVSLYVFAGCAVLGMLPPAVLAARARRPTMAVIALVIAAYAVFVFVVAAGRLTRTLRGRCAGW